MIENFRGGYVPQVDEIGGDYYEKFNLDYGCVDNVRVAGFTRGLIQGGKLLSLPESDPFLKWVNEHLEKGPEDSGGRLKPYYVTTADHVLQSFITVFILQAADFGSKKDLLKGENPVTHCFEPNLMSESSLLVLQKRVIIVNRKLAADSQGVLLPASQQIDVEVREIWQPWLKGKCDFVARYIVPNRVNIIKILEAKGRFHSEVCWICFDEGGCA